MLTDADVGAFRQRGALALPQLFTFEEIAWLREAAIALAQRHGATRDGRSFAPATVRDVHLAERGFYKLAAHPRVVDRLRQLVDGEIALRETRLCIGTGFDILPHAADEIGAIVFLDAASGPASRLGSALLVDGTAPSRDQHLSAGTLAFVATYARAENDTRWLGPSEPDDCLWPSPFATAG